MSRRSLALMLCFLLICSTFIPISLGFNAKVSTIEQPSIIGGGKTLYVGGSGPDNYTTIQNAINDANEGDTVFVYDDSSPYYENVFVIKSINLIGEDKNTTIVDANSIGNVIEVNADNVTISGFTIQHSGKWPTAGIRVEKNYNYTLISNNNIFYNTDGIWIYDGSSFNNILNNNIRFNKADGITLWDDSLDNIIQGNIISNNGDRGIFSASILRGNKILYNKIFKNKYDGILIEGYNTEISFNEIYSNRRNGILMGSGLPYGDLKISKNNIHNNLQFGINLNGYIWGPGVNIEISNNNIESNLLCGLKLHYIFSSEVKNNNIHHNIVNAHFVNSFGNKWDGNYWGSSNKIIKIIIGFIKPIDWFPVLFGQFVSIPFFNIDRHPAKEPYNIGGLV